MQYFYGMLPTTKPGLLFIDDDPDDGNELKISLQAIDPDINFLQVFDGWNAIMHLQKLLPHEQPQLIVLDINMRIINGFEFLKIVKEDSRFQKIPVVVYSTSTRPEHKTLSIQLGAVDYFTKPDTTEGIEVIASTFVQKLSHAVQLSTTFG